MSATLEDNATKALHDALNAVVKLRPSVKRKLLTDAFMVLLERGEISIENRVV